MSYHLFQYSLPAPGELGDLNTFLGTHRVVTVQHHIVNTPNGAFLVFVVQTTGGETMSPSAKSKIDYKEELTPEQFAIFSRLREERKKMAEAEGVPVYTIFTNEQLAEMVRLPARSLADLGRIEGIGKARLDKQGPRLLAILAAPANPVPSTSNPSTPA